MSQISELPDDILHLICDQLGAEGDFTTLYRCALAGSRFCDPALKTIYRLHDRTALVAGQDELEVLRRRRGNAPTSFARQNREWDIVIKKWALLWKSMIRSSTGKTFRPYASYIRSLNLQDLENLFEDQKFRGSVEKSFFAGDLAKFNIRKDSTFLKDKKTGRPLSVLDSEMSLNAVGEGSTSLVQVPAGSNECLAITAKSYLLEELGGHRVQATQLPQWLQNLPRLEALRIWSGAALSKGAGRSIAQHCPYFRTLTIFEWNDPSADGLLATFLSDLSSDTLVNFETFSPSQISSQSFATMSHHHRKSIRSLKLAALSEHAIIALPNLSSCTSLHTLLLEDHSGMIRLEETQNDVYLAVISWLLSCKSLASLDLRRFYSGPSILTSILDSTSDVPPPLTHLGLEGYQMLNQSASNFHSTLPRLSATLTSLSLKADGGEDAMPVDLDLLVNSITQLPHLKFLYLKDLSDNFTNDHIIKLCLSLPDLVELWTSGTDITDTIFPALSTLKNLKILFMYAMTQFTFRGIYDYISSLNLNDDNESGLGNEISNRGFWLSIMNADVGFGLTEGEQFELRSLIEERVGGRFDFTLWRDPDDSEFEGDSD